MHRIVETGTSLGAVVEGLDVAQCKADSEIDALKRSLAR